MAWWVLNNLRYSTMVLGVSNAAVVILGCCLLLISFPSCGPRQTLPFAAVTLAAAVRILAMVRTGIAQEATATTVLESSHSAVVDAVIRQERRMRYKKWIRWTRFATVVMMVQFVAATYLVLKMVKSISNNETTSDCILGIVSKASLWKRNMLVLFIVMVCFVALLQCFTGSDVLRWRSFYATEDNAWKAHYREVFDHGMREALCCLGRVKYLSVMEEDEVYSVARLLGDLVAYRASGTGHLELLAGLALFQRNSLSSKHHGGLTDAPRGQIEEAATLHKFAEAAYTVFDLLGPLLDFGRNPFIFPCAWLYRQGILTPWSCNRRPKLHGDNWWRGHAAAFLKYAGLPPDALRQGRVCQAKCEAAYFIAVLHHARTVVVAVRGTETPEDLITDGLCRECTLSAEDLDGLMSHPCSDIRQSIKTSFPHYGHSGIVVAARELFLQVEGNPGNNAGDEEPILRSHLSSLMGPGCECDGYNLRIVGHSLGGAIAAMLGLRLYRCYPNLHVYTYGSLPCVDSVVAEACSDFVTSIVYDNEFSARLSVGSIHRLRAAAIMALSQDSKTDTALMYRLARQFLYLGQYQSQGIRKLAPGSVFNSDPVSTGEYGRNVCGGQYSNKDKGKDERFSDLFLLGEAVVEEVVVDVEHDNLTSPFKDDISIANSFDDPVTEFMETLPNSNHASADDPKEMFLPGLIVHIVPDKRSLLTPIWKALTISEMPQKFKAYISDRETFKDIVVSPSMFLDHLPWRSTKTWVIMCISCSACLLDFWTKPCHNS
ncbi:uncharacterized protein LOC115739131 isoform X2 [Rhodamnia argentea]|uniref:Uncharacterized protein LOC115739131 isoform X2 n=1 Tax=Rhodamnia argentea TaxID=178133 RepID=A0ABM3GSE3_9MYRT|nr:uncharacterized protein LOC115739131 isoform X2 [Rhodamnia argentea]